MLEWNNLGEVKNQKALALWLYGGVKVTSKKTTFIKSFVRKVVRIMLIISAVFLICMLVLVGVLQACSPGKPEPFLDENGRPLAGSISEKIFININGVEQGMFIKGKDKTKPVILFLHGGLHII